SDRGVHDAGVGGTVHSRRLSGRAGERRSVPAARSGQLSRFGGDGAWTGLARSAARSLLGDAADVGRRRLERRADGLGSVVRGALRGRLSLPRDGDPATTRVHALKRRMSTSIPARPTSKPDSHSGSQTPKPDRRSHTVAPTPQRPPRRHTGLFVSASFGVILLCAAAWSGTKLQETTRVGDDPTELALFPTGAWIRPLACGFNELVADAVWLRALQYYGEHRASDRRYPYLETLFQTLTDLDPRFVNAYIFGALTLAEDE